MVLQFNASCCSSILINRIFFLKIFQGNSDSIGIEKVQLEQPIVAQMFRIIPVGYVHGRKRTICTKVEVYGCKFSFGMPSFTFDQLGLVSPPNSIDLRCSFSSALTPCFLTRHSLVVNGGVQPLLTTANRCSMHYRLESSTSHTINAIWGGGEKRDHGMPSHKSLRIYKKAKRCLFVFSLLKIEYTLHFVLRTPLTSRNIRSSVSDFCYPQNQ